MPRKIYLLRQAASLLRYSKETANPKVATVLLAKAADLNEKLDELSAPNKDRSARAPDVETDT